MAQDIVSALLHEPLWCACGAAYANGMHTVYPAHVYLFGTFYLVTVRIDAATFVEQHLAVRAFSSTYEKNKIVLRGERSNIRHAIGYLSADGIEAPKGCHRRYMRPNIVYNAVEIIKAFRGLRV